jgi:hypothetical protein
MWGLRCNVLWLSVRLGLVDETSTILTARAIMTYCAAYEHVTDLMLASERDSPSRKESTIQYQAKPVQE